MVAHQNYCIGSGSNRKAMRTVEEERDLGICITSDLNGNINVTVRQRKQYRFWVRVPLKQVDIFQFFKTLPLKDIPFKIKTICKKFEHKLYAGLSLLLVSEQIVSETSILSMNR